MKVILLQTIDRLGKAGDIITVKEGYARNYLIPKNAAKEATAGNMKILESLKKKQAAEDAKALDGTPNKSNLGANALLGVSMACAKAG